MMTPRMVPPATAETPRVADDSSLVLRALEVEPASTEALLQDVLDSIPDAVYVKGSDGTYLLCNSRVSSVLGISRDDLIGSQDWEIFPPEIACRLRDLDRRVIAAGESASLELALPNGRRTSLELKVLHRDSERDGSPIRLMGIARDVTHSRMEDEALRVRERQLADAQRLAQLGSWEWDFASDLITWSDPLHQIVGTQCEAEPLTLEQAMAFVHPGDRDRTRDILEHASRTGSAVEFEHRIVRRDGSEAVVLCRGVVTHDKNHRPLRMFGTAQDITAHREAEKSLHASMAEAERASEAKSDFLSRMSHELRTPLNAILGFGQVMAADPELADRESVEEILSAGNHLLEMINDILDLSRIEAGRIALSLEPVPLAATVQECCDMLRQPAHEAKVSVLTDTLCNGGQFLLADARRLKQVLLNLLSNAIKYNRPGGAIEISCTSAGGDRLRVQVRDTGIGMDETQLSSLFSPFERAGAERTGIQGTGLGLSLSKALVEGMGGELGVTSSPGEGSTFWFSLPLANPPQPAEQTADEAATSAELAQPSARKVLYIEDNPANLRLMQRIFARQPEVELMTATSGGQGLAMAHEEHPDMILLDVQLPDVNGDEVLWRLQQDPVLRSVPVVAVSGDATARQVQRLLDLGAREYLMKPFNVSELLRLTDKLLRERETAVVSTDASL